MALYASYRGFAGNAVLLQAIRITGVPWLSMPHIVALDTRLKSIKALLPAKDRRICKVD